MSWFTQLGQGAPISYGATTTDLSLSTLVGTRYSTSDGRQFVLVQNAGTALVSGRLIQGPAEIANHKNRTLGTSAIAATTITVALGATALTANQYRGGFLVVNAGTGIGQTLRVSSHPAADASATVTITLEDALKVATLTSDSKGTLVLPPYGNANGTDVSTLGVIVCPTTLSGSLLGVTISPIAASSSTVPSYGFVQTRGIVGGINHANTVIGLDLMPSLTSTPVAGSFQTYAVATGSRVGTATVAGTDVEAYPITIQL